MFRLKWLVVALCIGWLAGCAPTSLEPGVQVEGEIQLEQPTAVLEPTPLPTLLPETEVEPEPTPVTTETAVADVTLISHPEWPIRPADAQTIAQQLGCAIPEDNFLSVPDQCATVDVVAPCLFLFQYERQAGDPETTLAFCSLERLDGGSSDPYLYDLGIDHFVPAGVVVMQPEKAMLARTLADLQAVFGMIESAEEAMSFAIAATGHLPKQFAEKPHLDISSPVTYYVDTIEDSFAVANEGGFEVLLFSELDDCTPWVTTAVSIQVNPDATFEILDSYPVYDFDDNTCT